MSIDPVDFMGSDYNPAYFNRYAYSGNDPINNIDPDGQFFGAAGKLVKLAVKGGDIGATFAGAVTDTKTIFSGNASIGQRLGATASLATEIFSPVSARDAKAGAGAAKRTFHRLQSPTQTSADAKRIEQSGELFGTAPRGSDIPTVQAFDGPLPEGQKGIEFITNAQGKTNPISGEVRFRPGNQGVELRENVTLPSGREADVAVIKCTVTKNNQC